MVIGLYLEFLFLPYCSSFILYIENFVWCNKWKGILNIRFMIIDVKVLSSTFVFISTLVAIWVRDYLLFDEGNNFNIRYYYDWNLNVRTLSNFWLHKNLMQRKKNIGKVREVFLKSYSDVMKSKDASREPLMWTFFSLSSRWP